MEIKNIRITQKMINRFWTKIIFPQNTIEDCWEVNVSHNNRGYSEFTIKCVSVLGHRFSYTIHNNTIPDGFQVCHKCDNKGCVNPNHLFLGTFQDNMNDKVSKNHQCQEDSHVLSKTTSREVEDMLIKISNGYFNNRHEVADFYDISYYIIVNIVKGKSWKITSNKVLKELNLTFNDIRYLLRF